MRIPKELVKIIDPALLPVFESLRTGVIVLEGSRVIYANAAMVRITGYPTEELSGYTSQASRNTNDLTALVNRLAADKSTGRETNETLKFRKKDGTMTEVDLMIAPLRSGEVEGSILILTEKSTAKKGPSSRPESEMLIRNIINNAPIVLFSLDLNGIFTLSEGSGLRALNLLPGQMVGQSALTVYQDHPQLLEDIKRALRGEEFSDLTQIKNLFFETHYSPIRDRNGELTGTIGTAVDVTARRRMEDSLQKRFEYEKLISSLSNHFINLSAEKLDSGIQNALEAISKNIGADFACLFLLHQEKLFGPEYSWSSGSFKGFGGSLVGASIREYPWLNRKIGNREIVLAAAPSVLPPQAVSEKSVMDRFGIKSVAVVPLVSAGKLIGILGLCAIRTEQSWIAEDVSLFRITGEMFAGALDRRRSNLALMGSEEKFKEIFNNAIDPIFLFELSDEGVPGKFLEINDMACSKLGYTREELLGMTPFDIALPEEVEDLSKLFRKLIQQGHITSEKMYLSKNGTQFPVEIKSHIFYLNNRKVAQSISRDISDRRKAEETIRRQAYYDVLTNLPNRTLFKDRLEQAMKNAHRNKQMLGVILLDLDRFKNINETMGHLIGDKLLFAVAERLVGILSESETISRFGGDEFTLLLPQVNAVEEITLHAQKIIEKMNKPFKIGNHELHVTTSVGIAFYPEDGENSEVLLKNAETAMYRAKEQGRNNFQLYASVMNVSAFKQLLMENSLRRALENEEFVVFYQPQIDLKTNKIIGAEALVRWKHPDLGLVFPGEFIGLAEETGLIVPIGDWTIRKVCVLNKKWQDAGLTEICVSVNLSARQFQQMNLVDMIAQILQETGLDPRFLGLEVTESIVMKNMNYTVAALNELKRMKVHLSLDDFGTGYSSLSYLKRLPFETLKIDQSFVRDITTDPNDAAIVTAVVAMAHSLKLKVMAEGVETEGQLSYLREQNCDQVQGYFFSRPVPEEDFLKILQGQ